jgi:hypothetical protein
VITKGRNMPIFKPVTQKLLNTLIA